MKHLNKLWLLPAALLAVTSCSKDNIEPNGGNPFEGKDNVYFTFSVESSTRSATDDDDPANSTNGQELGQDYEDAIDPLKTKVLLVVSGTSTVIASTEVTEVSTGVGSVDYRATFKAEDILAVAENNADAAIDVRLYCNYGAVAPSTYDADRYEEASTIMPYKVTTEAGGTVKGVSGSFLMTNSDKTGDGIKLFADPAKVKAATSPENPLKIGPIYVERSAARFDIKAGGELNAEGNATNVYWFANEEGKPRVTAIETWFAEKGLTTREAEAAMVGIEITDIALINESNSWYTFRHVTNHTDVEKEPYTNPHADLTTGETISILRPEHSKNWVYDTNWKEKFEESANGWASYFNSHLNAPTTWEWTSMSDIQSKRPEDDDTKKGVDEPWHDNDDKNGYRIWRYATENTLPGVKAMRHGESTGVVYKGKIVINAADNKTAYELFGEGEAIYLFNNMLCGNAKQLKDYATAEANKGTAIAEAYKKCCPSETEGELGEFKPGLAKGAGFKVIEQNADHNYYVYYYYWNRHNDNNNDYEIGAMEFSVVRNNVYKLWLKEIKKWGYTNPNEDKPDPKDPDEDQNIYIKMEVKVRPWIVRMNEVKF